MRCAAYIRVSSDEQRKKGFSLPEQRRALEEYAALKNYKIIDFYADEGISASKAPHRRHDFQRMISDVRAGLIDIIIFIKLDRWFRNVGDYYRYQSVLDEHGVKWECTQEDYDTTTRTGRLNLNIKLTIAEDEAANASERVRFVFEGKIKNREPITGKQPFGYAIETVDGVKRIVKDPATRGETEDMFAHFFETMSGFDTARYINRKYGRNHADNTITRRLKNPVYTGEYRGIADYRPAYITHEQHALILKTFARSTRTAQKNKVYLFSGMLICPVCGRIMSSCTSNGTTPAYRCRYHTISDCSYRHTVKERDVEEFLLDGVKEMFEEFLLKSESKRKSHKIESPKKYEEQLERLTNVYIMGNMSDDEYRLRSAELKAKIADLKADSMPQASLPGDILKVLSDDNFSSVYGEFSREDKRALWRGCIDAIKIDGTTPVCIRFIG